ncbi:MAG TPA: histidine--tRNA ligase [Burkholderiaceae bacterium]|jgi:histidyl-tRNA synthetase|nr:histidine--tRNA ligase [Burkholderiaceae bacterium]
MASPKIAAVRGMNDLLPAQAPLWEAFETAAVRMLRGYGYAQIRTPILESTALFRRGIGEVTDIVEHEMYTFVDSLNGESLTLRPENTAGVVRAAIEHSLLYEGPCRLWYMGPMFRHERPQRGRYRQFYQLGAEALGLAGPDVDAEQVLMLKRLWQALGLSGLRLELNTLGQPPERARHRGELIRYLEQHEDRLDEDARRRLHSNPLRILDTKNPAMQDLVAGAPRLLDYLGEASLAHFDRLQQLLRSAGIEFTVNSRLVRGLDYYNLTVFEWVTDRLGAQGTVCGGGRYDGLIELLGGKPAPACGFSIGIDRVIELMGDGPAAGARPDCDVYVVHQGGATLESALQAAERLRDAGLDVIVHAGEASLKSQMKRADASGAVYAVIVGEREAAEAVASVKALRAVDASAPFAVQQPVALDRLGPTLAGAVRQRPVASQ